MDSPTPIRLKPSRSLTDLQCGPDFSRPFGISMRGSSSKGESIQRVVAEQPDVTRISPEILPQQHLCDACLQLWLSPTGLQTWMIHHATPYGLHGAVDSGCVICAFVMARLAVGQDLPVNCTTSFWIEKPLLPTPDGDFGIVNFRRDGNHSTAHLLIYERINPEFRLSTQPLPGTHASYAVFAFLKSCMADCLRNHRCEETFGTNPAFKPTRLLDLCGSIRLADSIDTDGELPYMTLSHCWGSYQPLRLLTTNYKDFRAGLPWDRLPKTFKDAITLTKLLGVRYLWIDSVCILQDSDEDWLKEAASMGTVYANSLCNIAATGAKDGRRGFICPRPAPADERARRIDLEPRLAPSSRNPCNFPLQCHVLEPDFTRRDFTQAPLSQRAWFMQELLLSPRVIHFAQAQVYWQCGSRLSSEAAPDDVNVTGIADDLANLKDKHTVSARNTMHRCDWSKIVERYSSMKLTYGSDRLVALSGFASQATKQLQNDYFAGIWKSYALIDLSWHVKTLSPLPRPSEYRAPSWSWAAVDEEVSYSPRAKSGPESINQDIGLLEIHVDLLDEENPTGKVEGGHLKFKTSLMQGKIRLLRAKGSSYLDHLTLEPGKSCPGKIWLDCEQNQIENEEVYCFSLQRSIPMIDIILLRPIQNSNLHDGEVYERIGIMSALCDQRIFLGVFKEEKTFHIV